MVCEAPRAAVLLQIKSSMARFLVVDDEINALSALRELLESDGHQVAAFSNAREAFAALKASVFDVVMTDLEIPHGQGDVVVKLTRQHQPAACVFVATHVGRRAASSRRVTSSRSRSTTRASPGRSPPVAPMRDRVVRAGAV